MQCDDDVSPNVSVCIATFNGMDHLPEQLDSILGQLAPGDEVIAVDDGSSDGTLDWLRNHPDQRVAAFANVRNVGHVATFSRALSLAHGRYVFLSDQDDVWLPGRVERMSAALQEADVVATNLEVFGTGPMPRLRDLRESDSARGVTNVIGLLLGRRPYFGCAMAVRQDFLSAILPIPSYMEAHDHWIALAANTLGRMRHLEAPSVSRRVHGNNLTPTSRRSLRAIVGTRVRLTLGLTVLLGRRMRRRGSARPTS